MLVNAEYNADRKHKTEKARSARREEGQGYADYGQYRGAHSYIYYGLAENHCENADRNIHSPIVTAKSADLERAKADCREQNYNGKASENSELLTYADEDKIVVAFGNGVGLSKFSSKQPLARKTAVCKGYSALPLLIIGTEQVILKVEHSDYSRALVIVHYKEIYEG